MADEEEGLLEDERLKEMDEMGVGAGVEVEGGAEHGPHRAVEKEQVREGMEGVEREGGGAAELVIEEPREMVVEGTELQGQVKAEMEEAGVGVGHELEVDEDAFSDDDLL